MSCCLRRHRRRSDMGYLIVAAPSSPMRYWMVSRAPCCWTIRNANTCADWPSKQAARRGPSAARQRAHRPPRLEPAWWRPDARIMIDSAASSPTNFARFIFFEPVARRFYPGWGAVAAMNVAHLRAEPDRDPLSKALRDLVGELSTLSDHFRRLWGWHDAWHLDSGTKRWGSSHSPSRSRPGRATRRAAHRADRRAGLARPREAAIAQRALLPTAESSSQLL